MSTARTSYPTRTGTAGGVLRLAPVCQVDLMVNPPQPGDDSYALYHEETTAIYESLGRRAVRLVEAFRKMEGVTCNYSQVGARD